MPAWRMAAACKEFIITWQDQTILVYFCPDILTRTSVLLTSTFCTIVTASHLPYSQVLYESIARFMPEIRFNVLVVDQEADFSASDHSKVIYHHPKNLEYLPLATAIHDKYYRRYMDGYRWSMKPLFIQYLLQKGYEKVICLDSDIYFFSDPGFLFGELGDNDILLTPHWRTLDPTADEQDFLRNFQDGIFNAGFLGANQNAIEAMQWWAKACLFKCGRSKRLGIYDDQSYLSMLPLFVEKLKVIRHRGCNVASWNDLECRRTLHGDDVLINDKYPIVFIHFSTKLIERMNQGHDRLLRPYLEEYREKLHQYGVVDKKRGLSWKNFFGLIG